MHKCLTGVREEVITCKEDVSELVKVGERNRHYGATQMNEHSSRSHVLFRLVIESRQCDVSGGKYPYLLHRRRLLSMVGRLTLLFRILSLLHS